MKEHFNPTPLEIMQRFKFHFRTRSAGQTVVEYVAALRKLTAECNFGDKLKESLLDRLVCGVNNSLVQSKLLGESVLTRGESHYIATAAEATSRHLLHLQAAVATQRTANASPQGDLRARQRRLHWWGSKAGVRLIGTWSLAEEGRRRCYRCGESGTHCYCSRVQST